MQIIHAPDKTNLTKNMNNLEIYVKNINYKQFEKFRRYVPIKNKRHT